ncbi:MAG: paraquat-inducible protein A [Gammaproteobacteria bacterium]
MSERLTGRSGIYSLLLATTCLFVAGIFAPLITFTKLAIFSNTVSMVSALLTLLREGHVVLFMVIFAFSICMPLIKLFMLWRISGSDRRHRSRLRQLRWLEQFGKWSMLDVFVVALLLVTVKLGFIGNVEVHYGVYVFAASLLMMMFVTVLVTRGSE